MNLRFQIPKFYVKKYGVEDQINEFCEKIVNAVRDKSYSPKVDSIDFIPIILQNDLLGDGLGEEFTKYDLRYKMVTLCRRINFDDYYRGDVSIRKTLLLRCLAIGLKDIEKKSKLDVETMINDIKSALLELEVSLQLPTRQYCKN